MGIDGSDSSVECRFFGIVRYQPKELSRINSRLLSVHERLIRLFDVTGGR